MFFVVFLVILTNSHIMEYGESRGFYARIEILTVTVRMFAGDI